mmetsp:Transcript_36170/g.79493  ORF Transcript_36170/g.79493 Transcript_36170/m.79493 type:complete len:514 (+) Transcript_36170:3078-4619(+)
MELGETLEHLRPRRAEHVAVGEGDGHERLERLDVPPAHSLGALEVGVLSEHCDKGVPLGAHSKLGGDVHAVCKASQRERNDRFGQVVARILHDARAGGEERAPARLEHWPHVLHIARRVVDRLLARLQLKRLLRLLHHDRALHVEELRLGRARHRGRFARHAVVLDLDLVSGDGLVRLLEEGRGQVLRVVDPAVHLDKLLLRHLLLDLRRVRVSVEHDERVGQHVRRVGVCEDARVVVLRAVPLGELLHHAVDLLRLARQPKVRQELAQCRVEREAAKVDHVDVGVEHLLRKVLALAKVVSNGALVEPLRLEEKLGDGLRVVLEAAHVLQVLDAALRLHVELDHALVHLVLAVEHGLKVDVVTLLARRRHDGGRRGRGGGCGLGAVDANLRRGRRVVAVARAVWRLRVCRFGHAVAQLARELAPLALPLHHRVGNVDKRLERERLERRLLLARLGQADRGEGQSRQVVARGSENALALEVAVVVEKKVDDQLRLSNQHSKRLDGEELLLPRRI